MNAPTKTARSKTAPGGGARSDTWSETAYVQLRKNILSGQLKPGSKLKIEQLREQYGVGPTPLREALSRLSSEGLVQIEHLKGFRVAPVSLTELEELCEVRVVIESEALRRAVRFGDDDWEAQIAATFHKLDRLEERLRRDEPIDADDWEERNREFHEALVAGANSEWLLKLRKQVFDHHERYRRYGRTILSRTPMRDVNDEHRKMMTAALARDGEELARLMSDHILSTRDLLGARFRE